MSDIYIAPISREVDIDFSNWNLFFDEAKTIKDNIVDIAKVVADEVLDLSLYIETDGEKLGQVGVTSNGFDSLFLFFDLEMATRGAAHCVVTNYSPKFREQHIEETKKHLRALRAKLMESVAVLDDAIEHPEKYGD